MEAIVYCRLEKVVTSRYAINFDLGGAWQVETGDVWMGVQN
jgi:hypothetical protein